MSKQSTPTTDPLPVVEHIAWQASDPDAMAAWYCEHLGFRTLRHVGGPARVWFLADASGKTNLEIYCNPEAPPADFHNTHPLSLHLALQTPDPEALARQLVAAGATIHTPPKVGKTGDCMGMLRDPWGFPVQLVKRAVPLGAKTVLCIGGEALAMAKNHPLLHPVGTLRQFEKPNATPAETDIPSFEDLEKALEELQPNLVLLAPPNWTKNPIELEEAILAAGVPLAITKLRLAEWPSVGKLVAASDRSGTPCLVRDHYHLSSSIQTARAMLPEIGELETVRFRFALPPREEGFAEWTASYGHLLLEDLCYHHFSTLEFLCGLTLRDGWCSSRGLTRQAEVRNNFDLMAETEGGWLLEYSGRWSGHSHPYTSWQGEITLEGNKGCLFVAQDRVLLNGKPVLPEDFAPATDWVEAMTQRIQPPGSPASCLLDVREFVPVADAIQRGLDWCAQPTGH